MWLSDDMDKALAFKRDQAERCGTCGTLREDWVDEDGIEHIEPKYTPQPKICFGCKQIERMKKNVADNVPDQSGVYVELVPFADYTESQETEP